MNGYFAAALAVLIWAAYPVATRAGVTGSFTAGELMQEEPSGDESASIVP